MSESPVPQPDHKPTQTAVLWLRLRQSGIFALGVLAALAGLLLYGNLRSDPEPISAAAVDEIVAQALASATPPPAASALVYRAILPSLVIIQTERTDEDGEDGFGVGSGVVVNAEAAILTSLHVVADATDIQVQFADGTRSAALITTAQPENDIAVLQPVVPPTEFLPAILGNPDRMRIGDEVFAVGNPLGLPGSMSAGVVSGFERSFTPFNSERRLEGLIQFDAAVNPGNSGGPLLNRQGQVVGIVTGLVNPTEQNVFIGIGFAVPISTAGGAAGAPAQ